MAAFPIIIIIQLPIPALLYTFQTFQCESSTIVRPDLGSIYFICFQMCNAWHVNSKKDVSLNGNIKSLFWSLPLKSFGTILRIRGSYAYAFTSHAVGNSLVVYNKQQKQHHHQSLKLACCVSDPLFVFDLHRCRIVNWCGKSNVRTVLLVYNYLFPIYTI